MSRRVILAVRSALALALATSIAAGCGDSGEPSRAPLNLERPVDLAFACWGGLRIVGANGTAEPGDPLTRSAQPMESCRIRSIPVNETASEFIGRRPPGQENLAGEDPLNIVSYYSFILQSVPGTVAVATFATKPPSRFSNIDVTFVDADPLTPGKNSVVVGALPVAIAADRDGCHMVTANAGSCDLSVLDIGSIVDEDVSTPPVVRTIDVVNAAGEPVVARPVAMIAEPAAGTVGVECPAEPDGLIYVAYPECHMVAAIHAGSGEIRAAIQFDDAGTVTITDGNVTCPAQCGGGGVTGPGERPVTLDLVYDPRVATRRLVIGADNSPMVTMVELDPAYLPLSFSRVALQGDIGLVDVALTPQIGIGGEMGVIDDDVAPGGQFQFVYAVADDGTVRVADVLALGVECDTQVDPRYLRGETNIGRLGCLPVGDPATPPRRPLARGPGIELLGGAVPTAVAVVAVANDLAEGAAEVEALAPTNLVGHFAFVTATTGDTVIVNIDDDVFRDLWDPLAPMATQVPLAVPHQLRDQVLQRDSLAEKTLNDGTDEEVAVPACNQPADETPGGPRLGETGVLLGFNRAEISSTYRHVLPSIRQLRCEDGVTGEESAISELAFAAPVDQRDLAFPDLRAIPFTETWNLTWEGALSRDGGGQNLDGPVARPGLVARDGQAMTITDPSRSFCATGAQPHDIAVLVGCDPTLGDAQCGLGNACYLHPDAIVASGTCLPAADVDQLAGTCREYLLSLRRYTIRESTSGEVRVVPRRHALTASPLEGCIDAEQCSALAAYELSLSEPGPDDPEPPERSWTCEPDPTRAPGPNRCQMTCTASADCDDGRSCSNGYCVEGVMPPAACIAGLQRFSVRAGEAYAVVGSFSGYLHSVIEDPGTGACVIDPAGNPLNVGRVPLTAPACPVAESTFVDVAPNPCSVTVEHTEHVQDYVFNEEEEVCEEDGPTRLVTREAPAIRFRNPAMTFHLVDPWHSGNAVCPQDRAAALGQIPTPHVGQQLEIPVVSGFSSINLRPGAVFPVNVVRGPESSIWIIDEGDNVPDSLSSLSTRGQVFRIETTSLTTINVVQ